MNKKIQIKMLGSFKMQTEKCEISEEINQSRKMWRFLEYVITFRNKTISVQEMIDILWPEDEVKNPYNALKNLLYRLRIVLESYQFPYAREMIVLKNNAIMWNPDIICEMDFEIFEQACKSFFSKQYDEEERLQIGKSAIALYSGDFLHKTSNESWIISINMYYHTLFIKLAESVLELLDQRNAYKQMIEICKQAILIDDLEEAFYYFMTKSLAEQGKTENAIQQYALAKDLFYNRLEQELSSKFKHLYQEIIHTTQNIERDISIIQGELREENSCSGCMYCEYEFFKNIYHMVSRGKERDGRRDFLGLLTLSGKQESSKVEVIDMEKILSVITKNLRRGDIITRYSSSQYLLMFPCPTKEDGQKVMNRLCRHCQKICAKLNVRIEYVLEEILPFEYKIGR